MVGSVRWLSPLFAAAALAIAACGDDDSQTREYRDQANALCRDALRQAEGLRVPSNPHQLEAFMRKTLRLSQRYTERLEALEAPAELADLHERSTRLNKRAEKLTKELADDLAAGGAPQKLVTQYSVKILEIGQRDNEVSRKLGLPDCVTPIPDPGGDSPAPA
jgi:hypothetical protein